MLAAAFALALMASGCSATTEHKVILEVTGPAGADVTYGIGSDQSQENGATLPWKKDLTSRNDPLMIVITAQSKATEEITCKITIDGKVAKENKSKGEFAVVTCSNV